MDSADYQRFLESEVKKALEFAQDAPMTVYLDPSDEDKLNRIALHTGAEIKLSDTTFLGGIQAVIPSKNILIDNSFKTKLAEISDKFQFRIGGR